MKKSIKNANTIIYKLWPALIRATNHRLELTKEKRHKRKEIIERRKTKTIVAKYKRARGEISFFSKEDKDYESDTENETDLDQANNKYLLQY